MHKTLTQNQPPWASPPPPPPAAAASPEMLSKAVAENAVVVLGARGCCMVHVMRRLLEGQGVNPTICEVAGDGEEAAVGGGEGGAQRMIQLPAVFIGGNLVGGLDRLMAVHISGELVPILRDAGALWL